MEADVWGVWVLYACEYCDYAWDAFGVWSVCVFRVFGDLVGSVDLIFIWFQKRASKLFFVLPRSAMCREGRVELDCLAQQFSVGRSAKLSFARHRSSNRAELGGGPDGLSNKVWEVL